MAEPSEAEFNALVKSFNELERHFENGVEISKWSSMQRDWSLQKMDELDIGRWLGIHAVNDLSYIFGKRGDYTLLDMIAYDNGDGYRLCDKWLAVVQIKRARADIERLWRCYYVSLRFKTSIGEAYYSGIFGDSLDDMVEMMLKDADGESFFPKLRTELEKLIPPGEASSDFYDAGTDDFAFYWDIPKTDFPAFEEKLLGWLAYHNLGRHFLHYSIQDRDTGNTSVRGVDGRELRGSRWHRLLRRFGLKWF